MVLKLRDEIENFLYNKYLNLKMKLKTDQMENLNFTYLQGYHAKIL